MASTRKNSPDFVDFQITNRILRREVFCCILGSKNVNRHVFYNTSHIHNTYWRTQKLNLSFAYTYRVINQLIDLNLWNYDSKSEEILGIREAR